jgi:hypothetical protein
MEHEISPRPIGSPKAQLLELLIVVAGIILGQGAIYGPCLLGRKILLPLDILAQAGVYLPRTESVKQVQPWDPTRSDLICSFEPARRFAARQFHAGRLPLWSPDYFAGAPCIWPIFSPFSLLECLTESPVIIAWVTLLVAVVAGVGMYLFCLRVLQVGFWPAAVCAWCYPMTGFFVVWQGYLMPQAVCVLPWLLLAVDSTVRRRSRLAPVGLSLVTGLAALGQLDITGQVLLVSGIYALWCLWDEHGREWFSARARVTAVTLSLGWLLGLMLAAPQVFPGLEYSKTGSRPSKRAQGAEERAPVGLVALPLVFLPDFYGRTTKDTVPFIPYKPANLEESAIGAYAGVLGMLLAAPLAFWSKRHRSTNLFLVGLAILGISWALDLPVIVRILRLPVLNLMSHNRLVFVTSFSFLALAAVGLHVLRSGRLQWKGWYWLLALPLAALSALSIYRALVLPEPLATRFAVGLSQNVKPWLVPDLNALHRGQRWFVCHSLVAGIICATGAVSWLLLRLNNVWRARLFPLVAGSLVAELLWFAQKWPSQCDPALYYPRVPALEQVAQARPGRVIGYGPLPANLASMANLRDIRGYNGVDPAPIVDLLLPTSDPSRRSPQYAQTQTMAPKVTFFATGDIRLPRVLDLLGVRYLILRGTPPAEFHPVFQSFDYYVLENTNALPRVFIPSWIEVVPDHDKRLAKMESADFDPWQTAFVESSVELPSACRGEAQITQEIPNRVSIRARMETAGLIVLTDAWDKGWRAYLDGQPVTILRTDHALRGVAVPAGLHALEFRYESASLAWGLRVAGLAALALLGWAAVAWRSSRPTFTPIPAHSPSP